MAPSDLDPDVILGVLEAVHREERADPAVGLRERKKRQIRQRISNTATALFLAHGFDHVTVSQIAAACEVSEQTVFNYFPAKETMFFDRSERSADELAAAVRHRGDAPLTEATIATLVERGAVDELSGIDEALALHLFRRFGTTIAESPTLAAAQNGKLLRLIAVMAAALAERVGANPDDPEVQVAAVTIFGLARARSFATFHHLPNATSIGALEASVRTDVLRAARVVAPALDAFDAQRRAPQST